MKLTTMLATGTAVIALSASLAMAKPAGTKWVWTEFEDVIDNDGGTPTVTFYDGTFTTKAACIKDVKSKVDTSVAPPCPLDNSSTSCGVPGVNYTFYRCLQGLFGTPKS